MAKIAIKGHKTRGKEVIEILEMLGGKNSSEYSGNCIETHYYIATNEIYNTRISPINKNIFMCFTLEEFLEKYPYKVGNKVQHKGATYCDTIYEVDKMRWVDDHVEYTVKHFWYNNCYNKMTVKDLQPYKEYKEETMEERKYADLRLDVDQDDKLATEVTIDGGKIIPPENYLIGKVTRVDNGMLVEFVKKQPQLPKTYDECVNMFNCVVESANLKTLKALQELIYCRNTYWKIAGEQMRLGKPWEYDMSKNEFVYTIAYQYGFIQKCESRYKSHLLVFPTKEMCDEFYENFKELIEMCKDFL